MIVELVLLDRSERRFKLVDGTEYTIGTALTSAIRLQAPDVSRSHALLTCQHGKAVLLDLGSTNGTFVNGRRIKEKELMPGDVVRFSSVIAQILPPLAEVSLEAANGDGNGASPTDLVTPESAAPLTGNGVPPSVQESLIALLSRWGVSGDGASLALVEWLVAQRGMKGAAIMEEMRGEVVVQVAHGDLVDVLEKPECSALVKSHAAARSIGTLDLEPRGGRIVVMKAPGQACLLLVPRESLPDKDELELLLLLLSVAERLDRQSSSSSSLP
jgi:FHA domain